MYLRNFLSILILISGAQIGMSIQKEVQQAHLEQIMKDLEAGEVGKAIRHLQFLYEDFAVTEDECR